MTLFSINCLTCNIFAYMIIKNHEEAYYGKQRFIGKGSYGDNG